MLSQIEYRSAPYLVIPFRLLAKDLEITWNRGRYDNGGE